MDEPHLTNRYLNLMAFAERTSPAAAQAYFNTLEPPTRERLLQVIEESPHGRKPTGSRRTVPALIAAVVTVAALAFAGIVSVQTRTLLLSRAEDVVVAAPGESVPPQASPEPVPPTTAVPPTAAEVLLSNLPQPFHGRCHEESEQDPAQAQGLVVELACSPAPGDPEQMYFLQYESVQAVEQVFSYLTRGTTLPVGRCTSTDPGRGAFIQGAAGSYGCYGTDAGENVYVWTDVQLGIMGVAADSSMTFGQLRRWQSINARLR
jgi:hypothetical protein